MSLDAVAETPAVMGPYRLEGLIGRGGMGEVYRAFDTRRSRMVALKILSAEFGRDEDFRARFRRESDNAARLQDPHVVPIHDFGEIGGRLYIDMRLVDGVGLDQLIATGPLDPRRSVALIAQVAEALTDAHAHGVLHRDVKPSNILVTRSDFVYLVDFGIARSMHDDLTALTRTGAAVGTLAYMAPERFEGEPPDGRADVYSLACTLAEALTGRRPFDATSLPSLMRAHLTADPPRPSRQRPDVPPALDEVIARGMAKDPAARYSTPLDLVAAAHAALQQLGGPTSTRAMTLPPPTLITTPPTRRTVRLVALVAGLVLLIAASVGTGYALARSGLPGPVAGAPAASSAAPPAPASAAAAPSVVAPAAGGNTAAAGRSASYVYTVESQYPVALSYIDDKGDQVLVSSVPTPWRYTASTAAWGADARPVLSASSTSGKGDTTVTCTIADDQGRVVANQTRESAYASVGCYVLS